MTEYVAWLSVIGYLLTAGGVLLFLVTTPRAIASIGTTTERIEAEINQHYRERAAALPDGAPTGELEREVSGMREQAYARAQIPYSAGLSWGGPDPEPMMLTLRRVWRASIPNTVIALVGGALSTIASVWSLYL